MRQLIILAFSMTLAVTASASAATAEMSAMHRYRTTMASAASTSYEDQTSADTSDSDCGNDPYQKGCVLITQGDSVNGVRYVEQAANAGDANGKYLYGLIKMCGYGGVKTNEKAGLRLIRQAAKEGQSEALYQLGCFYLNGEYGCPENQEEALSLFERSSQAGSLDGQIACGNLYLVKADTAMAVKHWRKAVEFAGSRAILDDQRESLALICFSLGELSQEGSLQDDSTDAADYYQLSIEYGDSINAPYALGMIYLECGDDHLATPYFKIAADAGNIEACVSLGDLLRLADCDASARLYYEKAAEAGDENAMYALAKICFEEGRYRRAARWAAQCEFHSGAVYLLGWIYYAQDDVTKAEYYWRQCVNRFHNADALKMLKSLHSEQEEAKKEAEAEHESEKELENGIYKI